MNNFPSLYITLTILFSGFVTYALLQYLYRYFRTPQKETLILLFFNCIAFIYVISDAFALFFNSVKPTNDIVHFFIIIKELVLLLFFIITPYFIDNILNLEAKQKLVNQILLWAGITLTVIIGSIIILSPDILITGIINDNPDNYLSFIYRKNISLLLAIRNIILIIYLLYMIAMLLFSKLYRKHFTPIKNTLFGLIILCYFAMTYLYSTLFTGNDTGFGNIPYPHFSLGITLFIVFIDFGSIDMAIIYNKRFNIVRNNLHRILYNDETLGIPNRMAFIRDIQSELNKIETTGGNFSLIFMDIDDFRSLNECYGQNIGNEILKLLTHRLIEYFNLEGMLYRIGGDEFVLFLKEINTDEEVKTLARKIVASFRNSFSVSGIPYLITASLGILQIPHDGKDTDNILNNAYNVIRSAKKNKNTFAIFTEELIDNSSMKINIVNLLRSSINRDQFTLFYQPIMDFNGKIVHAECLLRCTNNDPLIGGPGKFIPLMEEAGLSKELDNMVIRKAFHDMEMNIGKKLSIGINLSTNQLLNPKFSDFLSSFAQQHGIEKRQIILEVTESNLINNLKLGRESLMKLKNSGFIMAIDDFGSGFSSLAYLAELPVDILKIDMVFVQSVPGDSKKEAIAKHIIELAHSLNLKVIAEGFELPEQADFFKGLGCDLYQGYYFSRPLPLNELLAKYPD
jgi:diguanylate cyclase (GGDEF)-like protein